MDIIQFSQLDNMDWKEISRIRRQYAENRNIKSLLVIAKHQFLHGSAATNINNLPEMFYYFGRLHREEELQEFLTGKNVYMMMLPQSCIQLATTLFNIGYKFPLLSENEISFLEERYCDSKTFELFDIIMFDCDRLSRPIRKFNKESLSHCNTDFTRDFLLQIYDCFSKNDELDEMYDPLYVYSRIENRIISKLYEDIGLGEYCVRQPILSKEFWHLMQEQYGEECADYFVKQFSSKNWIDFKNSDFYLLGANSIEKAAKKYFNDSSKVNDVKATVALFWLRKRNSFKINLV